MRRKLQERLGQPAGEQLSSTPPPSRPDTGEQSVSLLIPTLNPVKSEILNPKPRNQPPKAFTTALPDTGEQSVVRVRFAVVMAALHRRCPVLH